MGGDLRCDRQGGDHRLRPAGAGRRRLRHRALAGSAGDGRRPVRRSGVDQVGQRHLLPGRRRGDRGQPRDRRGPRPGQLRPVRRRLAVQGQARLGRPAAAWVALGGRVHRTDGRAGVTPAAEADDLRRLNAATAHLEPPFAVIDLAAFRSNAADMTRRAGGTPIRLASKSVRCRRLIDDTLALDGFRGILAFTLPEALWLAECRTSDDIVVAYPTADTAALARLAADPAVAMAITVMVDSVEHLDLIARAAATVPNPQPVRVAIDIDAGYQVLAGRLRAGARRSPVRAPVQAAALAR